MKMCECLAGPFANALSARCCSSAPNARLRDALVVHVAAARDRLSFAEMLSLPTQCVCIYNVPINIGMCVCVYIFTCQYTNAVYD